MSYIKDSGCFQENIKTLECIPDDAILVTGDVVGLYSKKIFEKDINYQLDQDDRIYVK